MSLIVDLAFEFPLNSDKFHSSVKPMVSPGVYSGLLVTSSATVLSLNISPGILFTSGGVKIENNADMISPVALAVNSSGSARKDSIVLEYVHGSDPNINRPLIKVLRGDPGSAAPPPSSDQTLLAVVTLPDGASTINNSYIENVNKVSRLSAGGLVFSDVSYSSVTDDFDNNEYTVEVMESRPSINFSSDVSSSYNNIPGSNVLMAAKMALEGIFWGNFELEHTTVNSFGLPLTSEITIQEPAGSSVVIVVTTTYNASNMIATQVFNTEKYTMNITYTYPSGRVIPNVTQVVSHV